MERPEHQPLSPAGMWYPSQCVKCTHSGDGTISQESDTCQTLDLGCAWNHPLQEMEQPALRRPRGNYGLLADHQPSDDDSVNVVSSLGRIQQHIEHCCGRQEIRLWQGQLGRLVLPQFNHYH